MLAVVIIDGMHRQKLDFIKDERLRFDGIQLLDTILST